MKGLGLFSVVVTDLLGYAGAGVALGYFAWKKWDAPWWVLVLFSMAGLVLSMMRVFQLSKKMDDDQTKS